MSVKISNPVKMMRELTNHKNKHLFDNKTCLISGKIVYLCVPTLWSYSWLLHRTQTHGRHLNQSHKSAHSSHNCKGRKEAEGTRADHESSPAPSPLLTWASIQREFKLGNINLPTPVITVKAERKLKGPEQIMNQALDPRLYWHGLPYKRIQAW